MTMYPGAWGCMPVGGSSRGASISHHRRNLSTGSAARFVDRYLHCDMSTSDFRAQPNWLLLTLYLILLLLTSICLISGNMTNLK